MKSLNTNNIEEIKGDKPKKNLKQFLAVPLMVASLCLSACDSKTSQTPDNDTIIKNDTENIIDEDTNLIEDKEQNDKEQVDELDELTDIDDEQIIDNEENDTDTLVNDDDLLDPEIAEEFNKPCYNPFIVAEIIAKKCVEYTKYTVNGLECGITVNMTEVGPMQTLECETKKHLDELKKFIKEDKPPNWIDDEKFNVYEDVFNFYISEMYGENTYKLIDKPDATLSNNDTMEGYTTQFTFGGKEFFVVDERKPNEGMKLLISDKNGVQSELIPGAVIQTYDVDYPMLNIEWEYGYCFYPPQNNLERDFGVIGTYVLVNAKKAYDEINENNETNECAKVNEEQFEKYKEEVKKEN